MAPRASSGQGRPPRLDRHEVDRVARAVASGRRGLGRRLDGLADAVAAHMTAKLAAAGVRTSNAPGTSQVPLDRATRLAIVARVSKHLPVVGDRIRNGSSHAR